MKNIIIIMFFALFFVGNIYAEDSDKIYTNCGKIISFSGDGIAYLTIAMYYHYENSDELNLDLDNFILYRSYYQEYLPGYVVCFRNYNNKLAENLIDEPKPLTLPNLVKYCTMVLGWGVGCSSDFTNRVNDMAAASKKDYIGDI